MRPRSDSPDYMSPLQRETWKVVRGLDLRACYQHSRTGESTTLVYLAERRSDVICTGESFRRRMGGNAADAHDRIHIFTMPVDWLQRVAAPGLALIDRKICLDWRPHTFVQAGEEVLELTLAVPGRGFNIHPQTWWGYWWGGILGASPVSIPRAKRFAMDVCGAAIQGHDVRLHLHQMPTDYDLYRRPPQVLTPEMIAAHHQWTQHHQATKEPKT